MATAPQAADDFRMIFVTQDGPYQGQQLVVRASQFDAAVADGWGVAVTDAIPPNDTPPFEYGDPPQSYLDFLADAALPGKPPVVTGLSPESAEIGSADLTLTVSGTGFADGDVISFNGGDEPTTFVNDTTLTTVVKPSTASGPWSIPVRVNGAGGSSNALMFSFTEPPVPGSSAK